MIRIEYLEKLINAQRLKRPNSKTCMQGLPAAERSGRQLTAAVSPLRFAATTPASQLVMKMDRIQMNYHLYYICFHIFVRIWILIRIVSVMSDRIRLDIDIINMRFEHSDTDTVSDVKYLNSDTDRSKLF